MVLELKMSKLFLIVPGKSIGSWGIMLSCLRREAGGMVAIFVPAIVMEPCWMLVMPARVSSSVDLPLW